MALPRCICKRIGLGGTVFSTSKFQTVKLYPCSLVERGPYVEGEDPNWNRPPDLQGGEVNPFEAKPGDLSSFGSFYSDAEGHAPAYVRAFRWEPYCAKPKNQEPTIVEPLM